MAKTKEATNIQETTEKNEKKPSSRTLSKKSKIIICVVCIAVVIAGSIIGIIAATAKRFSIWTELEARYNNHENMIVVGPESKYNTSDLTYLSNGNVIIQDNSTGLYGLYSYSENKMLIEASYTKNDGLKEIELKKYVGTNNYGEPTYENTEDHIFKTTSKNGENTKEISFYNDEGERLSLTKYDKENDVTYGYIKTRKMELSAKGDKVKVKTKNDFKTKEIEIDTIEYNYSYIMKGEYNYEIWTLTDTDGNIYENLYKVSDGDRKLVQTINNSIGNKIGTTSMSPIFHSNGDITYISYTMVETSEATLLNITIYDENLNEKKTTEISINYSLANFSSFRVGKYLYFQLTIPASSDKYDFAETTSSGLTTETNYFRLQTYRLNLMNGDYSQVDFDYYISDYNTSFNPDVVQLEVRKVTDKRLDSTKLILINEKLQIKETDYKISSIVKLLNGERYLVISDNGLYLIDEDYKKVAFLGDFSEYFTTKNAIILRDNVNGYAYVCNMDGVVVAKYLNNDIINTYDDYYYMIQTTTEEDGITYTEKYLENLGVRQKTPIYRIAQDSTTYEYNNQIYCGYRDSILSAGVSIITRIRQDGSSYIYEFYNIDGDKLLQLENFDANNRPLVVKYDQEDNILLNISVKGEISYTLLLDR